MKWTVNKGTPTQLTSILVAVILVTGVFPDVIFRKASISMLDLANVEGNFQRKKRSIYAERPGRSPIHGFSDTGGAAWQSEPGQLFMRYCIYNGESPYWNPYSGAGSFGPETLVDVKFSPFSLLVAVTGGSSIAFHLVAILLYIVAVYFLFRTLTIYWEVSILSAIAACTVYLLNGYFIANLNSNVSQTVLYYPICLYALASFTFRPSTLRYLGVIFCNTLILSTTFMPTTSVLMISIYLVSGAYVVKIYSNFKRRITMITLQGVTVGISVLLLAFLYFPIVESFTFVNPFSMYGERVFFPASLYNFLSFFSPKHFWESYNAIDPSLWSPDAKVSIGNVVFHFGIVAALIVGQVFSRTRCWRDPLIFSFSVLFLASIGRIFEIPLISHVVGSVPFLRSVGEQYWWVVVCFSFTPLVAFGFETLSERQIKSIPVIIIYLIIGISAIVIYKYYGFPGNDKSPYFLNGYYSRIYILTLFGFMLISAVILIFLNRGGEGGKKYKLMLLFLIFVELTFYMNHLRYTRRDIVNDPPDYVCFLKENCGHFRIVNYGQYGVFAEVGAALQIQQVESMNMNIFPAYYEMFDRHFLTANDKWGRFCVFRSQGDAPKINESLLDLLAVKFIIVNRYMDKYLEFFEKRNYPIVFENSILVIFENLDHYPRIFVVSTLLNAELTADSEGFPVKGVAFTRDERLLELADGINVCTRVGACREVSECNEVKLKTYRHSKIVAHAKLGAASVIVLMDNWHPNWKAYANGKEVYIGRINESFRGIALAAGEYEIEFRYRPASLPHGLAVSGMVLVGLFILVIFRKHLDSKIKEFVL